MFRKNISNIVVVRAGNTVRASAKLNRKGILARISVWSSVGDYEFSPQLPNGSMADVGDPQYIQPLYGRLTPQRRKHVFKFIAEEDMRVVIKQEYDAQYTPAKGRIIHYGKITTKIRWYLGNSFRAIRRAFGAAKRRNR